MGRNFLGRVHTSESFDYEREVDEEGEYHIQFVEPGKDTAEALEAAKEPLHLIAFLIFLAVVRPRRGTIALGEARPAWPLNHEHTDVSPPPHRHDPSRRSRPTGPFHSAISVPQAHRQLGPATAKTARQCTHPRQPDESWSSSRRETSRGLRPVFFRAPVPSG